jgi:hypothetical protein
MPRITLQSLAGVILMVLNSSSPFRLQKSYRGFLLLASPLLLSLNRRLVEAFAACRWSVSHERLGFGSAIDDKFYILLEQAYGHRAGSDFCTQEEK